MKVSWSRISSARPSESLIRAKLSLLLVGGVLALLLVWSSLSRSTVLVPQAYAATNTGTGVGCITGTNGIAANGKIGVAQCGSNVTLKLRAGAVITSTSGFGVRANNSSSSAGTAGLYGRQGSGSGTPPFMPAGLWGDASNAIGVVGTSKSSYGVYGFSATGNAVLAIGNSGDGVFAQSTSGNAVIATSTSGKGVFATSSTGPAVEGVSNSGPALFGSSVGNFALVADGSAQQNINSGGLVKGLIQSQGGALRFCFNSQASNRAGAESCSGFSSGGTAGDYTIIFPFSVAGRYIVVTVQSANPAFAVFQIVASNQVEVKIYNLGGTLVAGDYVVAVF